MGQTLFSKKQAYFLEGATRGLDFRLLNLRLLRDAMHQQESLLIEALRKDLGKPLIESFTSEIGTVLKEIDLTLKSLRSWARPQRRKTPLIHWPAKSYVHPEPKGVVLIIGPWNYPLQLTLLPLVGALAAGNCAVIKPSELAPNTAEALSTLLSGTFPEAYCQVVKGDQHVTKALLTLPWDHIFFTGSTRVGRQVMQAAARRPSPVTLELGGKNPCIILEDAAPVMTAERIAWAKFLNAGQTCGAPDHLYIHSSVKDVFVQELIRSVQRFYGPDPRQSPDYARIINNAHFERLAGYLKQGTILSGGEHDPVEKYFAPTLLTDVAEDSKVVEEEIFGPILPIFPFQDLDLLLDKLQAKPKPLAAYLFTRNKETQKKILSRIQSGTAGINDVLSQITTPYLPLGGIGESGLGAYHGRATFDCFTHYRSVLAKGFLLDNRMKYPPYRVKLSLLKKIYKWIA
jgi:acyl-CoA reductase-like NAD-dependent aldehyde dehydrogenase